jgi:lycopene beta-cyclase
MGAADVANSIARDLKQQPQAQDDTTTPTPMPSNYLDKAAASAYHSIWNPETIRQRNFAVFGGEFLMKQTVVGLRGFFNGFFQLPLELWAGFLAGMARTPQRQSP